MKLLTEIVEKDYRESSPDHCAIVFESRDASTALHDALLQTLLSQTSLYISRLFWLSNQQVSKALKKQMRATNLKIRFQST